MAIKIDLLPGYVGLRRVRKGLSWGAAALVGATAGVLFLVYYKGQQQLDVLQENLGNVEANAKAAEAAAAAATEADKAAAPVTTLVEFITAASRTGAERASLLDLTSRYIYSGATINEINLSEASTGKITIKAQVKSPEDYKAFLLNLRLGSKSNNGLLFAEDAKTNMVVPSGIPGFPNNTAFVPPTPGEQPIPITFPLGVEIAGVLLNPVKLPVEPGATAPAAGATGTGTPMGGPTPAPTAAPTPAPTTAPAR